VNRLLDDGILETDPMIVQVAAVSCGIVDGQALLDLQYSEDCQAQMDANFVMTPDGGIIEVQATAEDKPLPWEQLLELKKLAEQGIGQLARYQLEATGG
jgi:ribonuclease PH